MKRTLRTLRDGRRVAAPPRALAHAQGGDAPFDFDLTVLLAAARVTDLPPDRQPGISLPSLVLLARDVTGNTALTEADVRAQLNNLLARGLVAVSDNRWRLK
jgi:hypothetical protein